MVVKECESYLLTQNEGWGWTASHPKSPGVVRESCAHLHLARWPEMCALRNPTYFPQFSVLFCICQAHFEVKLFFVVLLLQTNSRRKIVGGFLFSKIPKHIYVAARFSQYFVSSFVQHGVNTGRGAKDTALSSAGVVGPPHWFLYICLSSSESVSCADHFPSCFNKVWVHI